ncbi:MAG TPA: hypothetical protein VGI06_14030 [Acidimicrobiales bacterium]|jgi:hypothetical protein
MGGPRFSRLEDGPWEEVRKIGFADGRTASVRERWLDFSPGFLSLVARWDPGMMVHAHGHCSNHVVYVLEGEVTCGDVRCPPGTHIALDQGDSFGPFVAGPEGALLFEVMMGDPRSEPADPDGWKQLLAAHQAEQLPNPPINMPDWLEDTRSAP